MIFWNWLPGIWTVTSMNGRCSNSMTCCMTRDRRAEFVDVCLQIQLVREYGTGDLETSGPGAASTLGCNGVTVGTRKSSGVSADGLFGRKRQRLGRRLMGGADRDLSFAGVFPLLRRQCIRQVHL